MLNGFEKRRLGPTIKHDLTRTNAIASYLAARMKFFQSQFANRDDFQLHRSVFWFAALALTTFLSSDACAQRIRNSIPVDRVPAQQLQQDPPVQTFPEITYLRAPQPKQYLLDSGDVLGVFLEGILGQVGEAPPVNYPPESSRLGPSIGFPIVVRENGTVSLPLVDPISVRGLTVEQAEALIKSVYLGEGSSGRRILTGESRIIVTLQRERTINVIVVRQDNSNSMRAQGINRSSGPVFDRSDRSARLSSVQLPAYEGDVFNALIESGGLPGVNAARDVRIYRSENQNYRSTQYGGDPSPFPRSSAPGVFPRSNSRQTAVPQPGFATNRYQPQPQQNGLASGVSIPLRGSTTGQFFDNRQAALSQGDVVVVEARPTEVYYTGGLLPGGERPLPRDKTLSVLEAIALAGGPTTNNGGFGLQRLPPTELIVARNNGRNGQVNIRVDLDRAVNDPTQQILVAPGDYLYLRYKPADQVRNLGIGVFNTYGLRQIFQ